MPSFKMDKKENLGVVEALRVAEREAASFGSKADVSEVLEYAEKEIRRGSLKSLWQDAAEFGVKDEEYQTIFEVQQLRVSAVLGVDRTYHGHVVGHALVRAAEGGYPQIVMKLRKGLAELKCSVLTPRFMSFAILTAVECGNYEVVQELLHTTTFSMLALMGYELSKCKDGGYPYMRARLTTSWIKNVAKVKSLLPSATPALNSETLELKAWNFDEESIHDACRACYQNYCVWRFLIIAVCNGHGAVVQELLMKSDDCIARPIESMRGALAEEIPQVSELQVLKGRIVEKLSSIGMKVAAKLGRDIILYALYNAMEKTSALSNESNDEVKLWRCTSRSQFGVWEVFMDVPVLLMELETSYQNTEELKQLMRPYHYIKPIIPQLMKLNIQLKVLIDIQPNYIEVTIGINHVRVTVDNQMWEEKRTGHFPTFISLAITPVTPTMTSVSMTASSSNMVMKVGVAEQVRLSVQTRLKAAPTATVGIQFAKSTMSKIDGKPWRMEQLPTSGDQGGRFNWNLSTWHGQAFDRRNPMLQETKKSIWQFGKRSPINPLAVLPLGTNGGVHFTGTEYDDTLSWRFPKELENTDALFNVEGVVHTTYITQDTFWETRMVPFELQVEQKLEPCGDALGADKKKKKKKK
ncbi:uncharacterized protein [Physcomitrium patens]|uniref:Uncharacterized protein n=1 Tax=Physcomitrium patens TaxID=3218 RepID=A0A2K1L7S1_PHYPA|nr:uncharacterized protein LOC112284856 [Physcomitrium patens]XP_024380954.1 uncharacterized protein LOC112284856 [Physcomitrium patens]PNR62076.1 hypothetical protein PHYPA_000500 [Physcomitrium patens]|eukprot:XP_024380944.1 uncharacterized protein LOC112284856 [Physcomitrella patens]